MTGGIYKVGGLAIFCLCMSLPAQDSGQGQRGPWQWGFWQERRDGDHHEWVITEGVSYRDGDTEIHAESAIVWFDLDEMAIPRQNKKSGDLPRRSTSIPDNRRRLNEDVIRARLSSFLQSMRKTTPQIDSAQRQALRTFKAIYMEGDVVIQKGGIELLRAKSLLFSAIDNRAVFEEALLRLYSKNEQGQETLVVVKSPKLVRQGARTIGRQVSVTTCNAGHPHYEILSGEVEIIERENQFEIRSRDNTLAFSGRKYLPLPDAHFFTAEQTQIPIRGAKAGYSSEEKIEAALILGSNMNQLGGAMHNLLTGRPSSEFHGDWELSLGYNEVRGYPVEAKLSYGVADLYQGSFLGFTLADDGGNNRSEIRNNLDLTPITERDRGLIHTENRVQLSDTWSLDISVFNASDPGVYSEFFRNEYYAAEIPESSLHLRYAEENRIFTLTERKNLNSFNYRDNRALAAGFLEEEPVGTFDIFSVPILPLTEESDVLLTASSHVGQVSTDFDPRFTMPLSDRTFRADQEVELAAPFHWGPITVRPFTSGRYSYFDRGTNGMSQDRWAFKAGAMIGTRLQRSWLSNNNDGTKQGIQHILYPTVTVANQFQVDGQPTDLFQHDEIDSLDENNLIRVGLLNRFMTVQQSTAEEALWLDLAQNFLPNSERDNQGEVLGLLEYEFIIRTSSNWSPLPNLKFLVEGEHDWETGMRTLNTAARFGEILGLNWIADYRTDSLQNGTVGYGAFAKLFQRWTALGFSQFDLERDDTLNYVFSLQRNDHDWLLAFDVSYDFITDDAKFNVNFEPIFGGIFRPRTRHYGLYSRDGVDAMFDQ